MQYTTDLITLADIEKITGVTFKTIKKRLGDAKPDLIDGSSHLYSLRKILSRLVPTDEEDGPLDLTQERAKLASVQAEKTQLVVDQMKGKLVPVEGIEEILTKLFTAIRAKALALPTKIAPQLMALSAEEIESILKDQIYDLLSELSTLDQALYTPKCFIDGGPEETDGVDPTATILGVELG